METGIDLEAEISSEEDLNLENKDVEYELPPLEEESEEEITHITNLVAKRKFQLLNVKKEESDEEDNIPRLAEDNFNEVVTEDDDEGEGGVSSPTKPSKGSQRSKFIFGEVPGSPIGTCWEKRVDVSHDRVHGPWVAGIHGSEKTGCYSVVLSGGYEDDIDDGESFIYTGAGGRDLKGTKDDPKNLRTAEQSADQKLTRGNKSLWIGYKNKNPIRVIRGFKLKSKYAPTEGYRYDGLYIIKDFWKENGKAGFIVIRFKFFYLPDQIPPWKMPDYVPLLRSYPKLKTFGRSNTPTIRKQSKKKKIDS